MVEEEVKEGEEEEERGPLPAEVELVVTVEAGSCCPPRHRHAFGNPVARVEQHPMTWRGDENTTGVL